MSQRALNVAFVDQIRESLQLGIDKCGLAPVMGRPPAMSADRYIGVWSGPVRANHTQLGLQESHVVYATVTFRTGGTPYDRFGSSLVDCPDGMNDFMDMVRLVGHRDVLDHSIINRANVYIAGYQTPLETDPRGFAVGLEYQGRDQIQPVRGEWFNSDDDEEWAGLVCNLQFGGAVRLQQFYSESHEET